jgi:hypothetical protein
MNGSPPVRIIIGEEKDDILSNKFLYSLRESSPTGAASWAVARQ